MAGLESGTRMVEAVRLCPRVSSQCRSLECPLPPAPGEIRLHRWLFDGSNTSAFFHARFRPTEARTVRLHGRRRKGALGTLSGRSAVAARAAVPQCAKRVPGVRGARVVWLSVPV